MDNAYRVGAVAVAVWLLYVVAGFSVYDAVTNETELTFVVMIAFIGLIVFPCYFTLVALYHLVRSFKRKSNG